MITVLRLGHRIPRDARITTHCTLVARALGADQILIDGRDRELEETMAATSERWGGEFVVRTGVEWRRELKGFQGFKVHLTMYGLPLTTLDGCRGSHEDVMFIIGAGKVPREVYERADLNLSVGNQPHSEVAALALALDRWTQGGWQDLGFPGGATIEPSDSGKVVHGSGPDPKDGGDQVEASEPR